MKKKVNVNTDDFSNRTWDGVSQSNIKTPKEMIAFFKDIEKIFKKYNFSISHEDSQGGFNIEKYSDNNMEWLRGASKNY